jgi:crossover junction endodeoxyribonuclease RuvC
LIEAKGTTLSLIDQGEIVTKQINPLSKKLEKIYSSLLRYVEIYRPTYIVIEKLYSHYKHPTTAYYLGNVKGLISLICGQKNIPLIEYGSTRIKKAITGKGNASKFQVQKMVEYLLSLKKPIKSFDISDALSLAVAHACISKTVKLPN